MSFNNEINVPLQSGKFKRPGLHFEHLSPIISIDLQVQIPSELHDLESDPWLLQLQSYHKQHDWMLTISFIFNTPLFFTQSAV